MPRAHATLSVWTPKRAHTFALRRLAKIEFLLEEIAGVYGDVDMSIDSECTELREQMAPLREALNHSLEEGRSL